MVIIFGALVLWDVLLFTKLGNNKKLFLIPLVVTLGVSFILELALYVSSNLNKSENMITVIDLAIVAFFIVSMVFALKGKKWAMISCISVLGFGIFMNFIMHLTFVTTVETKYDDLGADAEMYLSLGLILIQIAQVVFFCGLLGNKNKTIELTESVASKDIE